MNNWLLLSALNCFTLRRPTVAYVVKLVGLGARECSAVPRITGFLFRILQLNSVIGKQANGMILFTSFVTKDCLYMAVKFLQEEYGSRIGHQLSHLKKKERKK